MGKNGRMGRLWGQKQNKRQFCNFIFFIIKISYAFRQKPWYYVLEFPFMAPAVCCPIDTPISMGRFNKL